MIFGRDRNVARTFIERALRASRSVGRVRSGTRSGRPALATAVLISPRMVMTCNHVLPTPDAAADSEILFDYYADADGSFAKSTVIHLAPELFFATDEVLDVTIVAIDEEAVGSVSRQERPHAEFASSLSGLSIGQAVSTIHHPLGEPQAFSLRGGDVVGLTSDFVHYDAPTQPGSAGAPIFDDNWGLVALHHAHVARPDPGGQPVVADGALHEQRVNEGARADRIRVWAASLDMPDELRAGIERIEAPPVEPAISVEAASPAASVVNRDEEHDTMERDGVFISYAHEDQKQLKFHETLELHLRGIETVGPLSVWQDGRIRAGTEWLPEIEQALDRAKVAVFLVGPHFLVSQFIREKEVPPLLEAARSGGVRIFPLATHNVAFAQSFLGKFQFFGDPNTPLENLAPAEQSKALVQLVRAIADVFAEMPP